ncbi:MAG TPA: 2Fe-2S iron-sulfur cluster-binding protein [Vicinamibacterales bacterium]|jgi:ferredoxin-NADP reductase|nr:2Fe-2S iron-sulfur cluster-binding protein [Vicinamibacterales bacterium]
MLTTEPLATSFLAFITTIHMGLVVLRMHRSPVTGVFSFVTPVSIALAASPWLLSSPTGVAAGLATQFAWFVACERLLPVPVAMGASVRTQPSSTVRQTTTAAPPPPRTMPRVATAPAPAARRAAPAPPASRATVAAPAPPRAEASRDFVQVPVIAVLDEARGIKTFRLGRPDGFEFKAGQFLTIRLRADGKEHARCYSISSRPEARGYMEISVKRLGSVSATLHASVRAGGMLAIRMPAGAFVYPAGDDRPIVLIAGGIGITPLMSMLRHGLDAEPLRPVTLVYSVRTPEDIAFRDEIRALATRHPQFSAVLVVTDADVTSADMFPGRITAHFLSVTVPDVAHSTCMVCGPPPMIDDVKVMLAEIGVPAGQIQYEIFQPTIAASAGAPVREQPVVEAPASHEIRFERSGVSVRIEPGETLLEAAERCGADVPSLCRAGVCGTCRTRVLSGDAECASQILGDRDRADGYTLPCVARPFSDCVLEA